MSASVVVEPVGELLNVSTDGFEFGGKEANSVDHRADRFLELIHGTATVDALVYRWSVKLLQRSVDAVKGLVGVCHFRTLAEVRL